MISDFSLPFDNEGDEVSCTWDCNWSDALFGCNLVDYLPAGDGYSCELAVCDAYDACDYEEFNFTVQSEQNTSPIAMQA